MDIEAKDATLANCSSGARKSRALTRSTSGAPYAAAFTGWPSPKARYRSSHRQLGEVNHDISEIELGASNSRRAVTDMPDPDREIDHEEGIQSWRSRIRHAATRCELGILAAGCGDAPEWMKDENVTGLCRR